MIWKKFSKMTKYTIVKNYVRLKGEWQVQAPKYAPSNRHMNRTNINLV